MKSICGPSSCVSDLALLAATLNRCVVAGLSKEDPVPSPLADSSVEEFAALGVDGSPRLEPSVESVFGVC